MRFLIPGFVVFASVAVAVSVSVRPARELVPAYVPSAMPVTPLDRESFVRAGTTDRDEPVEPRPGDPWPAARREESRYLELRSYGGARVRPDTMKTYQVGSEAAFRVIRGDYGNAPDVWHDFAARQSDGRGPLAPRLEILTKLFPDTPFATSFTEYAAIRGGHYFSDPQTFTVGDFKYDPEVEIPGFVDWLEKYPGHPGQDDACYRIARCFTIRKDMYRALHWFRRAREVPDGDMKADARCWELLLLDALLPMDDLRAVASTGDAEAAYSLGVRLFRRGDTRRAAAWIAESLPGLPEDVRSSARSQLGSVRAIEKLVRGDDLYALGRRQYHDGGLYANHLWEYGRAWHLSQEGVLWVWGHDRAPSAFREEWQLASNRLQARRTFLRLVDRRPGPGIEARARFSATTALGHTQGGHFEQRTVACPQVVRIRLAEEYRAIAREFPESNLADDALVFSGLYSGDPEVFLEVRRRFPNGDMVERAEREYARARYRTPKSVATLEKRIRLLESDESEGEHWRTASLLRDLERHLTFCVTHINWLRGEERKRAIRGLVDWFDGAKGRLEFDRTVGAYVVR